MTEITVEQLKERIDAGEKLNIIDVRDEAEYVQDNIGAKLLPLGSIMNMQIEDIEDLKNEELIVHCKAGSRSMQACMMLEQFGFTNCVNVKGGILAWHEKFGDAKINPA